MKKYLIIIALIILVSCHINKKSTVQRTEKKVQPSASIVGSDSMFNKCSMTVTSVFSKSCAGEACFAISSSCKIYIRRFELFNRWGSKLFTVDCNSYNLLETSKKILETFRKNTTLENGVYIYQMSAEFEGGFKNYSGSITLI